jgi:hypothetical protein
VPGLLTIIVQGFIGEPGWFSSKRGIVTACEENRLLPGRAGDVAKMATGNASGHHLQLAFPRPNVDPLAPTTYRSCP